MDVLAVMAVAGLLAVLCISAVTHSWTVRITMTLLYLGPVVFLAYLKAIV